MLKNNLLNEWLNERLFYFSGLQTVPFGGGLGSVNPKVIAVQQ